MNLLIEEIFSNRQSKHLGSLDPYIFHLISPEPFSPPSELLSLPSELPHEDFLESSGELDSGELDSGVLDSGELDSRALDSGELDSE